MTGYQTDYIDDKKANINQNSLLCTVQSIIESVRNVKLNRNVPTDIEGKNHAFVVLGTALTNNGMVTEKLITRLEVTLKVHQEYPNSKIIVTGGATGNNPDMQRTEASAMYEWLVKHNIDSEKIIEENRAGSTIENALYSMKIIEEKNIKNVTIISSGTHMRRALALFAEANQLIELINRKEKKRQFSNVVYPDFVSEEQAKYMMEREEAQIYHELVKMLEFSGSLR